MAGIPPEYKEKQPKECRTEDKSKLCADIISSALCEDFLSVEIPPREWLIEGLLYQGQNAMIFSKSGVGKTNFSLALAAGCAAGGEIFGTYRVPEPVSVLYLDAEMPAVEMQERARSLWIKPPPDRFKIISSELLAAACLATPNLTDSAWRDGLLHVLKDNPQYKLLVLDNLSSLCPGVDENSGADWDGINQWLMALRRTGLSTIIDHHAGKGNEQRGTSKREDQLDLIIRLTEMKDRKIPTFRAEFQKARSLSLQHRTPFVIERHNRGADMVLVHHGEREDRLVRIAFLVSRAWPQKDIAQVVGLQSQGAVSKCIQRAKDTGLLTDSGKLTQFGEAKCACMIED